MTRESFHRPLFIKSYQPSPLPLHPNPRPLWRGRQTWRVNQCTALFTGGDLDSGGRILAWRLRVMCKNEQWMNKPWKKEWLIVSDVLRLYTGMAVQHEWPRWKIGSNISSNNSHLVTSPPSLNLNSPRQAGSTLLHTQGFRRKVRLSSYHQNTALCTHI